MTYREALKIAKINTCAFHWPCKFLAPDRPIDFEGVIVELKGLAEYPANDSYSTELREVISILQAKVDKENKEFSQILSL